MPNEFDRILSQIYRLKTRIDETVNDEDRKTDTKTLVIIWGSLFDIEEQIEEQLSERFKKASMTTDEKNGVIISSPEEETLHEIASFYFLKKLATNTREFLTNNFEELSLEEDDIEEESDDTDYEDLNGSEEEEEDGNNYEEEGDNDEDEGIGSTLQAFVQSIFQRLDKYQKLEFRVEFQNIDKDDQNE